MKKSIELTPEWVLEKIPHTHYADGDGNISVYTESVTDANWIELALDSLYIEYKTDDYSDDCGGTVFSFEFRIEDIKDECPVFYTRMKKMSLYYIIYI